MDVRFRPLSAAEWLHPVTPVDQRRSRYAFKAGWANTLKLLERELEQVGATDVIIGAGFREQDIRIDGWPRANALTPGHSGVEVSYTDADGERRAFATDSYDLWQHNVRAIALSLEALRAVERWGATHGRQYAGFRALPAAGESTRARGEDIIERFNGSVKLALRATHPDTRSPETPYNDADHMAVKAAAGIA